jgi:predicted MarR family transcription regulator
LRYPPARMNPRKRASSGRGASPDRMLFVTSAHLAQSYPELSEFEYGLIVAWYAFERWMLRCMAAAGSDAMAPVDVLVLHHLRHRDKAKRLADICFVLNIEDTHVVSYSLKKLVSRGLVQSTRNGKEVLFSVTSAGRELCASYQEARDACLVQGFARTPEEAERLAALAKFLRSQAGAYDQASRAATVSVERRDVAAR